VKIHSRYVDELLRLKAGSFLLQMKLFPNGKEITESFAMFEACRNAMELYNFSYSDKINVVVVGDGHTPRTATTFAVRSKWNCHSVDPNLNIKKRYNDVQRLFLHPSKIEELNLEFDNLTIVLFPHAHVNIETSLKSIKSPKIIVITMECCVDLWKDISPHVFYRDRSIWSTENEIKIKQM
jgi:hypothetical protein